MTDPFTRRREQRRRSAILWEVFTWVIIVLGVFLICFIAGRAMAFPETARHGYFSCSSCHVSPAGGGALTDYGRGYSAEKLSTWSYEGEERFLHGVGTPDWLVVGGNVRQIQTASASEAGRFGRWIGMQRDLELCLHGGPVWACGTGGIVDTCEGEPVYGIRKGYVRTDIGEHLIVRAGRFYPRYGLMTSNHTSVIRGGLGYGQYSDTDQLEATLVTERLDITLARGFGRRLPFDAQLDVPDPLEAVTATVGVAVADATKLGASFNENKSGENIVEHKAGLWLSTALATDGYLLAEVDRTPDGPVVFAKAGLEVYRGMIPYLVIEHAKGRDMLGYGLQLFPRPHFEIDALAAVALERQSFSYARTAYVLLNYYP